MSLSNHEYPLFQGAGAVDVQMNGNVGVSGSVNATSFSGGGSGLTSLNPANIAAGTANINISGNAATVTNGVITTGSYANPPWITSLSGSKISGNISGNATNVTGIVPIANGGTGAATASGALANLGAMGKYSKVGIVAQAGGDYTNPVTAMNNVATWCGTPSSTNPCLLKIMPGVYTVTSPVVMQSYIDIEGSGEHTTIISGELSDSSWPPSTATVIGNSHAELRFLMVWNGGTGAYTTGILNSLVSPWILHVTVNVWGGTAANYGIYNNNYHGTMTNVLVEVGSSGPTSDSNYGIINWNSSAMYMMNVEADAAYGTNNYGIDNENSSPTMTNVNAWASGTNINGKNYGVFNGNNSSPTMMTVTARAYGLASYGVAAYSASGVKIDHSVIVGEYCGIYADAGTTIQVGDTKLAGGVDTTGAGSVVCAGVYSGGYVFYPSTCPTCLK